MAMSEMGTFVGIYFVNSYQSLVDIHRPMLSLFNCEVLCTREAWIPPGMQLDNATIDAHLHMEALGHHVTMLVLHS